MINNDYYTQGKNWSVFNNSSVYGGSSQQGQRYQQSLSPFHSNSQLQQLLSLLSLLNSLIRSLNNNTEQPQNNLLGSPIVDAQDGGPATNFTDDGVNVYDISESVAKALGVNIVPGYDYYLTDNDENGLYSSGDTISAAIVDANGGLRSVPVYDAKL